MFGRLILICGLLSATAATASAQPVIVPRLPPSVILQPVPPTPPEPAAPVHFDDICVRVTGIAVGGSSFSFTCQLQGGQSYDYRVANYEDTTGTHFDIGQSSSVITLLQNVAQEIRISQRFAGANSNISQVVTTFLLFKQANPDSQKLMLIRGVYSIDPTPGNNGDRAVQVVDFHPG